jgi:hypothetical protein
MKKRAKMAKNAERALQDLPREAEAATGKQSAPGAQPSLISSSNDEFDDFAFGGSTTEPPAARNEEDITHQALSIPPASTGMPGQ